MPSVFDFVDRTQPQVQAQQTTPSATQPSVFDFVDPATRQIRSPSTAPGIAQDIGTLSKIMEWTVGLPGKIVGGTTEMLAEPFMAPERARIAGNVAQFATDIFAPGAEIAAGQKVAKGMAGLTKPGKAFNEARAFESGVGEALGTIRGKRSAEEAILAQPSPTPDVTVTRRMRATMGQKPGATEEPLGLPAPEHQPGLASGQRVQTPGPQFQAGDLTETKQVQSRAPMHGDFVFRNGKWEPKTYQASTGTPPNAPQDTLVVQGSEPYIHQPGKAGAELVRPSNVQPTGVEGVRLQPNVQAVHPGDKSPNLPALRKNAPRMTYQTEETTTIPGTKGPTEAEYGRASARSFAWDKVEKDFEGALKTRNRAEEPGARMIDARSLMDRWRKDPYLKQTLENKDWNDLQAIVDKMDRFPIPAKVSEAQFGRVSPAAGVGLGTAAATASHLMGMGPAATTAGIAAGVGISGATKAIGTLIRTRIGRTLLRSVLESGPVNQLKWDAIVNTARIAAAAPGALGE